MKKIVCLDYFCGAGGTSLGFKKAGIDVVLGIDADEACQKTYIRNIKGSEFVCDDIVKLNLFEIKQKLKKRLESNYLLMSGCAPCQPFTSHFKQSRNDRRRNLLASFGDHVKFFKPDFIFVENVPGMQRVRGNSIFRRFLKTLEKLNYYYSFDVLDAKHYGVPQTRRRLVIIASRLGPIEMPSFTHGDNLRPYRTVKDVITKYPRIAHGETHSRIFNHRARVLTEINLNRMKHTPKDGGTRAEWPKNLWLDCHKNGNTHTDVYGRMRWNEPSPALTCKCTTLSNGRYGHPRQNRAISEREAAALQTFPDSFKFFGNRQEVSKQIGNAVPVQMAKVFGQNFRHQI